MSNERRIAPRKVCAIPIRIRPVVAEPAPIAIAAAKPASSAARMQANSGAAASGPTQVLDMQHGETVNLSERGIYFKTPQKPRIGQAMELYFTLPRELTGRSPEPVRCSARVVHVEQQADERGWTGIGAAVERFEPLKRFRTWDN